jgi:hypothetical protein
VHGCLHARGWNLDFEATGQAPNVNQTMWTEVLRFYDTFAKAVKPHGIKTTAAVMCTANVTSPSLCKNGLPYFNDSATAEMVSMMRRSAVDRWISMVRKMHAFLGHHFMLTRSIYQDRLGTNMRKS